MELESFQNEKHYYNHVGRMLEKNGVKAIDKVTLKNNCLNLYSFSENVEKVVCENALISPHRMFVEELKTARSEEDTTRAFEKVLLYVQLLNKVMYAGTKMIKQVL